MKFDTNHLAIAAAAGAVLLISIAGLRAQGTADPHHPDATPPAGTAAPAPKAGAAPAAPGMGGMMGQDHMGMMKMMQEMHGKMMGGQPKGDRGPASQAFSGITARMHQDMAITFSANTDTDFAKLMVFHHQGAVDMAKVALAFATDAEIKRVAEGIVKAQEAEIARLQGWLKKKGQ